MLVSLLFCKINLKANDLPFVDFLRRGLIMGIWNSHVSVGNIVGSAIAGIWAGNKWYDTSFHIKAFHTI